MTSTVLTDWRDKRRARLEALWAVYDDQTDPARRAQIAQVLVVKLAAEFQGFARQLHDQAIAYMAASAAPDDPDLVILYCHAMSADRALNRNNPGPDTLMRDFKRIDVTLWPAADSTYSREQRGQLRQMIDVRSAIVHDDQPKLARLVAGELDEARIKAWQNSLDTLAGEMDDEVGARLGAMFKGSKPW
ncbi:hypothetical protein LO762_28620 [Actinocorallia sp. API 0066]|uniref:hypothetical protein n=1 Tax=Actinocorallia sp. API 0066 TaxID=2896846 RepID=UPI001E475777|nr:hypothetical protein [Actinocorallia sp. API 0066]MCD0453116.1 hypothetical protein [Actinocorallia sp. API 0066]